MTHLYFEIIVCNFCRWHEKVIRKLERRIPSNIYLFKVNYRNRKMCETCSKLAIETERRQWLCFGVFIVNFEHISHLFQVLESYSGGSWRSLVLNQRFIAIYSPLIFLCGILIVLNQCFIVVYSPLIFLYDHRPHTYKDKRWIRH